jgi:deoxycytidine triphosphate deaminase
MIPSDRWVRPDDFDAMPAAFWLDPLGIPDGAVLAARQIHELNRHLPIVRPFEAELLRPASLGLTASGAVLRGEHPESYDHGAPIVVAPGERIVMVPGEVVRMPHFLVGRLGPTVASVHRGLHLAAGLHVDPGYMGALSVPLVNIAAGSATLTVGRPFARLELVKITPFSPRVSLELLAELPDEDALYRAAGAGELGDGVRLFERDRRWRHPLADPRYRPDHG